MLHRYFLFNNGILFIFILFRYYERNTASIWIHGLRGFEMILNFFYKTQFFRGNYGQKFF